jgi:hypothetical protein
MDLTWDCHCGSSLIIGPGKKELKMRVKISTKYHAICLQNLIIDSNLWGANLGAGKDPIRMNSNFDSFLTTNLIAPVMVVKKLEINTRAMSRRGRRSE